MTRSETVADLQFTCPSWLDYVYAFTPVIVLSDRSLSLLIRDTILWRIRFRASGGGSPCSFGWPMLCWRDIIIWYLWNGTVLFLLCGFRFQCLYNKFEDAGLVFEMKVFQEGMHHIFCFCYGSNFSTCIDCVESFTLWMDVESLPIPIPIVDGISNL